MLTALRAAAVVIIATGLNDVVAGAVPRYEPLYLYLGAVALVTALDGIVLGACVAVLTTAFYALLFMPRELALGPAVLVPFGAAAVTSLVVAIIRGLVRSRRRVEPPVHVTAPPTVAAPPLLPPSAIFAPNTEVLGAIDELRAELRNAMSDAASARERENVLERTYAQAREALTARLHVAEGETARLLQLLNEERTQRARSEAAAREYAASSERVSAAAREQVQALTARVAELDAALQQTRATVADRAEAARGESDALRSEIGRLRGAVEAARTEIATRNTELAKQREALEAVRRERDVERGRADGERALRQTAVERITELERAQGTLRARIGELEQALAEVAAAESDEERELRARVAELERELVEADGTRAALEQSLRAAQSTAAEEATRLHGEATSLQARITSLEAELSGARAARSEETENAASESRRLRARVETLQDELGRTAATLGLRISEAEALRSRVAELQQTLEAERTARADESKEFDHKLRTMTAHLAETREKLAGAAADSESRTGEAEALRSRIAELEQAVASEGAARANESKEFDEKLQTITAHLAEDHEADLGKAFEEREAARAEARALTAQLNRVTADLESRARAAEALRSQIVDLEQALASERSARADESKKFDEKLQTITAHLAEDHEADLGTAVEEREAARAEARGVTIRLNAALEEVRRAQADAAAWRARVQELEAAAAEEKTAREQREAELDKRLNTIVAHLAEDHEADLGKALEEREQARAEARSLGMRLSAAQKKVDEQRRALDDATQLLTETRDAAQAEINALRARLGHYEGSTPPAEAPGHRPRILIVHPDPDLRSNARATLERSGYEVVGAADGLEALRTAMAMQPDVVIAESVMPKMDGRELCQLLKSQEKTAHIRIILLTRGTDPAPVSDLPPDEILRKPVPLETLKATLANLLSTAR